MEPVEDGVHRREMGDLARPVIANATSCIRLPPIARNYDLKGSHYSMLPHFYGLSNEDPLAFIRDFYSIVEQLPLNGLNENHLRMGCFPHTLKDRAKAWLVSLPPNSLNTWDEVCDKFMEKFYSHQKTTSLRQQIFNFVQLDEKAFHESWERFKKLLLDCPHHYYAQELLNQFFYDGLSMSMQCLVDGAANGTINNKTATEVYDIYEMIGANSHQKSVRGAKKSTGQVM